MYAKDVRYEHWKRTEECISEKCAFLPVCGGGCSHDAMVTAGNQSGSANRYCQKSFLQKMNEGLLALNY